MTLVTAGLILLTDKLLPLQPGLLDPVFSGGILPDLPPPFGRSRRSAFIAGLLGVLLVDLASVIQLLLQGVEEQLTLGSGGLFSSMVLSAFLAVIITEVIGEVREALHLGADKMVRRLAAFPCFSASCVWPVLPWPRKATSGTSFSPPASITPSWIQAAGFFWRQAGASTWKTSTSLKITAFTK